MSARHGHLFSRDEVAEISERPVSALPARASLALAAIGLIAFVVGVFIAPDRAWRALHFSWLFFAVISSAGVMFTAIQRITTARWSRSTIRFVEGYVAFMPVAFIILALLVLVGRGHIYPWFNEVPAVREKAIWFQPSFFIARTLGVYLLLTILSIWYIWS